MCAGAAVAPLSSLGPEEHSPLWPERTPRPSFNENLLKPRPCNVPTPSPIKLSCPERWVVFNPILQMKKRRLREVKLLP